MNNALQKTIPRFFIGSFFIALVCAALGYLFITLMTPSSDEVVLIFFYTFFIVFIPSAITTFVFTSLRKKQVATIVGIFYWHF